MVIAILEVVATARIIAFRHGFPCFRNDDDAGEDQEGYLRI